MAGRRTREDTRHATGILRSGGRRRASPAVCSASGPGGGAAAPGPSVSGRPTNHREGEPPCTVPPSCAAAVCTPIHLAASVVPAAAAQVQREAALRAQRDVGRTGSASPASGAPEEPHGVARDPADARTAEGRGRAMAETYGMPGAEALRLRTSGVELHAVAAGPPGGPLVVLLHGFPEFWWGWRRQIGPLAAAGLRVVAPDQRGYNLSDKPEGVGAYALDVLADDVLGLADALGRGRFAVVGHDWGAVLAWHLAARDPGRVERAAVLNGPHLATARRHALAHPTQALRSWYVAFLQLPLLPEWALRAADFAALRRAMAATARPGTFSAGDFARYRAAWARPGALTAMLNWYRALPSYAASPRLGRIRVPVRVVWGDRDAALDRGLAEAGLALCDCGEVFHLRGATHWVQHEEPDRVNRLLVEFLA